MLCATAALSGNSVGRHIWSRLLTGIRRVEILDAREPDLLLYKTVTISYEGHEIEKECEPLDGTYINMRIL